jgi:hypothetical protein
LGMVQGAMGPFANPIGVRIGYKRTFKNRFKYVTQGMVDHSVTKWSSRNEASFGLMNIKTTVRSWTIGRRVQLRLQLNKLLLKSMLEARHCGLPPLPFARPAIGKKQVGPGRELIVHLRLSNPPAMKSPGYMTAPGEPGFQTQHSLLQAGFSQRRCVARTFHVRARPHTRRLASGCGAVDIRPAWKFSGAARNSLHHVSSRPRRTGAPLDNPDTETCARHHPKSPVVVAVVRVVPVAVGATRVPLIVPERTATQHTAPLRLPPQP